MTNIATEEAILQEQLKQLQALQENLLAEENTMS